jgi:hypothetical protein
MPSLRSLLPIVALALGTVACGAAKPQVASAQNLTVERIDNPEDAPEEAKTVHVEYTFPSSVVDKDIEKTFTGGFEKPGLKVDEKLTAHAHFDVTNTKISGTVTYVKKSKTHYQVLDADLVAEGHYDASMQVDFDVTGKGDFKTATQHDWERTAVGGKTIQLAHNLLSTNIPVTGPLFLNAHFDLSASCELKVEGQMHATTGVGVKGDVLMHAAYKKDGFEVDGKKKKFQFDSHAPNFEFAPKPYLNVAGKQQSLHGRCSLAPTAVILVDHAVGAKLSVEPYVELDARREMSGRPWKYSAKAGIAVVAATDVEIFGRQMVKAREFTLHDKTFFELTGTAGAPTMTPAAAEPAPTAVAARGSRVPQLIGRPKLESTSKKPKGFLHMPKKS